MSKSRSMYAGSSGSNYGVNKNSPGNGNNKWQGLPSITNMPSGLNRYIRTKADGDNRNVVFCINQLGGVGKSSNMFASSADGLNKNSCNQNQNIQVTVDYENVEAYLTGIPMTSSSGQIFYAGVVRLYNSTITPTLPTFVSQSDNNTSKDCYEQYNGLTKPYWSEANTNGGGFDAAAMYFKVDRIDRRFDYSDTIYLKLELPPSSYISIVLYYTDPENIANVCSNCYVATTYTTTATFFGASDLEYYFKGVQVSNPYAIGNKTIYGHKLNTTDYSVNKPYTVPITNNYLFGESYLAYNRSILQPHNGFLSTNTGNLTALSAPAPIYRISMETSLFDLADGASPCSDSYLVAPGMLLPSMSYLPSDIVHTDFEYGYMLMNLPNTLNTSDVTVSNNLQTLFWSISSCFASINIVTPESNFINYSQSLYDSGCLGNKPENLTYTEDGGGLGNSPFFLNSEMASTDPSILLTDSDGNKYLFFIYCPLQEFHDNHYAPISQANPSKPNQKGALWCPNSSGDVRMVQVSAPNLAATTVLLPAPSALWCIRYRDPQSNWVGSPLNVKCSVKEWNTIPTPQNIDANMMNTYGFPYIKTVDANSVEDLISKLQWDPSTATIIETQDN